MGANPFSLVPLFPGSPLPSALGFIAGPPFSVESIVFAPLAAANTALLQADAYARGVVPSGASPLSPFPTFPPIGVI